MKNELLKLFANAQFILKLHRVGKIFPVHVTVCLNNSDRSQELSLPDVKRLGTTLFKLKCQAVTIMGGDPLQHPYINEIIKVFDYNCIKVGIVTHGDNLHYLMDHIPVYWIEIKGEYDKKYIEEQKHRPICRKWIFHDSYKGDFTHGRKDCWVSLLKPVISADGQIFPCWVQDVSMGDDLLKLYTKQKPFDGSKCEFCYSDGYNEMLDAFVNKPERLEWL